jgi:hypothetical protein
MTNKNPDATLQIDRLNDMIFQNLSETNDEEILAEAVEDGMDVDKEIERITSIISDAIFTSGQAKLAVAKKELEERRKAEKKNPFHSLSIQKKNAILNSVKSNDNLKEKVTLAARNENNLSEADIEARLQSWYELKLIDEDGNLLCD